MHSSIPLLALSLSAGAVLAPRLAPGTLPPSTDAEAEIVHKSLVRAIEESQRALEANLTIYVDHSSPDNPWRVTSAHFAVEGTRSFGEVDSLAQGLEQMLPSFQNILGTRWTPSRPLQVIVMGDLAAFNVAGNDWGDARSSYTSSFLAPDHPNRAAIVLSGTNQTQTLMWATNAAAQQFVDRAFGRRIDPWLEQGIGAYFSLWWDWDWGTQQLEELIARGNYIPLVDVLAADIADYANGSHARVIELGMFFSYLLHTREETKITEPGERPQASFQNYLQSALRGRDVSRHPFVTWYMQNSEKVERDFRAKYGG